MIDRQYSSGISVFDRSTIASPVAMAIPSRPSHSPARPMTTHSTVVMTGQGATTASTGAKKNPAPMYHADPARSAANTKRSHRGIGRPGFGVSGIVVLLGSRTPPRVPTAGRRCNYL
jgi:hypothetical protein